MHSLEINRIVAIENLNHSNDFHIIFEGGQVTFNPANGPLRFWYPDGFAQELIVLQSSEDVAELREKLFRQKSEPNKNEQVLNALREIEKALSCYRDGLPYDNPEYGELCSEELKYCVVDQILKKLTGEKEEC